MKSTASKRVLPECVNKISSGSKPQWHHLRPLSTCSHVTTKNHYPSCPSGTKIPPLSYNNRRFSSKLQTSLPSRSYASSTEAPSPLSKTPLHDLHIARGAKMVPFAGYSMPVQYSDLSVGDSHRWTREKASLFDVGHMVQHRLSGPGATGLLLRLTPSSIVSLPAHSSTLSALLHPITGGIVDDTIVTRLGPELFYIVTNAACREKDTAFLAENIDKWIAEGGGKVEWEVLEGWGLIALQGPLSAQILEEVLAKHASSPPDLKNLFFGSSTFATITLPSHSSSPENILLSRAGYTGEDGFEISLSPAFTTPFTEHLLQTAGEERLRLAGLGARDSLRLEAGMCLYGHDLDDSTTPVEGGLSWIVGKDRHTEGGFHGAEVIQRQLKTKKEGGTGVERRRVGFVIDGAPAREGAEIVGENGEVLGKITSGCPSPTLGKNIAMGYVRTGWHKQGTEVGVVVRGKKRNAVVTRMPFVETRYWKGLAPA